MNWIFLWMMFIILAQPKSSRQKLIGIYLASATPLPQGQILQLNPYIKYWESAGYDRKILEEANQHRIRQKRETTENKFLRPVNKIKLKFFAHDREFRLLLREDPLSVFAPDVEIESTSGSVNYDLSKIYTGVVEGEEDSHVHGVITSDNLFDGTISTKLDQYYIEPSNRYSKRLDKRGIHSIVYKLSDVHLRPHNLNNDFNVNNNKNYDKKTSDFSLDDKRSINQHQHYCASERLHRKLKNEIFYKSDDYKSKNINQIFSNFKKFTKRKKRWLPEEMTESQNPPLPLDLDVPYNDDFSVLNNKNNNNNFNNYNTKTNSNYNNNNYNNNNNNNNYNNNNNPNINNNDNKRNNFGPNTDESGNRYTKNSNFPIIHNNRNFIKINSPFGIGNNNRNNEDNIVLNRKNILVNNYNPNSDLNLRNVYSSSNNNRNILINNFDMNGINNNNNDNNNNENINNKFNTSKPSHKTHVEIITKHGSTKKPNIIFNNYNPDIIITNNNPIYNSNNNKNIHLNLRNEIHNNDNDINTNNNNNNQRSSFELKSTCMLYLQADHTFFQKMGSDEASIEAITRHVQRANTIYKNTDFNGDGKPDNITFMIKRIKIHNLNALKDPSYRFPGNYGVEKFLELFSEEDYDAFCLAYMFTYRDFEMGTLGLAWTGDLKNAGGVCEKNGHYRGSLKSLNTGIVTLLNYGKHVPPAVSHVTLAHEIGHNFGSPHDPEQCTPGGEDGNFIMFARATSGDKKNNNKFSPCSLKSIEPVLNAKARSAKGCFTERQLAICGNGVVEHGEECDCGWEEDCKDMCCYPMSRHPSINEKPCTLTPRASCSPSQGPCCTTECTLKVGDKCRDDNGCRDPSYCDGETPRCPPSVNKPNKTICNKEFVCYMGDCTGSICLAYGLESCQCIPGPNDPKTKSCELCCKIPGETNQCKSSFEWNESPYDVPDMFAKPGTPCNDYNGYCDVFQKCREVDPSGPLATLRKLLLSEESIASFKKWMISNWYTVVFIIIAVLVLLVLSAKLLGKKSNSKLKSVTIIHSATTETVRLPEDNNGVIVHTAVRSKVPLKKKVRGERKSKVSKIQAGIIKHKNQSLAHGNTLESPKKATKKKKRVSAPVVAEEQQNIAQQLTDPIPIKTKKQKNLKTKHKEIIDYSNRPENSHTNTFGKVQKWLLESPIIQSATNGSSQIQHTSKVTKILSKSHSTPERLTQRSPKKIKSVGNINEKVKLQVVYKPPFKFSLKLSKNNGVVKTHTIGGGINRNKRPKGRIGADKKRISLDDRNRRSAILVQTITSVENNAQTKSGNQTKESIQNEQPQLPQSSGPMYDNLNSNKKDNNPVYENLNFDNPTNINTATFRIKKSSSGSNIVNKSNSLGSNKNINLANFNGMKRHGSSSSNLNQIGMNNKNRSSLNNMKRRSSVSNSNSNLNKNFGSMNSLIRSNTINLSKQQINHSKQFPNSSSLDRNKITHDIKRGSTSNLNSSVRNSHGNNNHHSRGDSTIDDFVGGSNNENKSRSRKNSSTKDSRQSINQNYYKVPSLKRGNISNIPRANLKTQQNLNFKRQTSLQISMPGAQQQINNSQQQSPLSKAIILDRPHTSSCDNLNKNSNPFEWPKNSAININDPIPSDLEVFVSDVENLVNDN